MSQRLHLEQWICFEIESETYAHQVSDVQEILNYIKPVPVPGAPHAVEGVLNIRGEIVTVLSSRRILGLSEPDDALQEHIVVMLTPVGPIGVMVDKVQQIKILNRGQMEYVEQDSQSPVKGTIHHEEQLIILTDFNRCLSESD